MDNIYENEGIVQEGLQDFGNKIGGAKKDIYGNQSLSDELEVKKSNLWSNIKKSDYKDYPEDLFKLIKDIRKVIPNKPVSKTNYHEENYSRFINEIKNIIDKTTKDTTASELAQDLQYHISINDNNYEKYLTKKLFTVFANYNILSGLEIANEINSIEYQNKILSKKVEKELNNRYVFLSYIEGTSWLEDAYEHGSLKTFYDNKLKTIHETEQFPKENFKPNTIYVVKKDTFEIVGINYENLEKAKEILSENIKDEFTKTKEDIENNGISLKTLDNIERKGEQYRKTDITSNEFIKKFELYGVEFGNWVTNGERQNHLNIAYDSLMDLSKALNISLNDITLNNRLSLSFGSRGSGQIYAHYEPKYKVINLTRYKGAGSLSHEYAHALDHYLANKFHKPGVFFSESDHPIAQKLMNSILYKESNAKEILEFNQENFEKLQYDNKDYLWKIFNSENKPTYNESKQIYEIVEKYINTNISQDDYDKVYGIFRENNEYPKIVDDIAKLYYDINTREMSNEIKEELTKRQKNLYSAKLKVEAKSGRTMSNFYYNSGLVDYYQNASKTSFSSKHELFSRAFSCYVNDKLAQNNEKNDYLNGHCFEYEYKKTKHGKEIKIVGYPENEERNQINKEFDLFFDKLKEINLFKSSELLNENIKQDLQSQTKINDLRGEQLGIYDKIHSGHKVPDKGRDI